MKAAGVLAALLVIAPDAAAQETACPAVVQPQTAAGWARYRDGALADAEQAFRDALGRCPLDPGARVGLGYVALRRDNRPLARQLFGAVLARDSAVVDALVGLGILAWRDGDLPAAADRLGQAVRLAPDHAEARALLARVPSGLRAPARPPFSRPPALVLEARVQGSRFEVAADGAWRPFYVNGVNLGAALPGRHPSEFPDSAAYARWLRQIAATGANTVRVYTIHPPHFYQALRDYNAANPLAPLRLVHGVWTELPPRHDFDDPVWRTAFGEEMRRAVDVVHGRATLAPRPGHASGVYTADVSPWTLAWVIGREWEPFAVQQWVRAHPDRTAWDGRYVTAADGNAMDVWLAAVCDALVAYEVETYNAQRPVAYTSWPPLDPLHHPSEATADEEAAIRAAAGETVIRDRLEYDNDAVSVDPSVLGATDAFPAGVFAAYHVYPYYPDFLVLDAGYAQARSSFGPSSYFGYLLDLKRRHAAMPVLIAEYGVPTGFGIAHLQPQGWHHGGHGEAAMAAINARLTREIAEAGMAGGILFAWIDEWFKKNWMVIDFEIPGERNRLWHNRLDPEQQYGVFAMDADGPRRAWTVLYRDARGTLAARADEAALSVRFVPAAAAMYDSVLVGFDIVDSAAGAFRLPGRRGERLPVGLELLLAATRDTVRVLAAPGANQWRLVPLRTTRTEAPVTPAIANRPPGFFSGRYAMEFGRPYRTVARDDGLFQQLLVLTNPRRFGRDTVEYAALGYDRGILPPGAAPDGAWERDPEDGAIVVRIPWTLLNVTDPSRRRVLWDPPGVDPAAHDPIGTVEVDGIRIVAAARGAAGRWVLWPAGGDPAGVVSFTWATWEEPAWTSRARPLVDTLPGVFADVVDRRKAAR